MKAIWQNLNINSIDSWCCKRSKLIKHKKVELIYSVCAREREKQKRKEFCWILMNFLLHCFSFNRGKFIMKNTNSNFKNCHVFLFVLLLLCFIEWREPNSHKRNYILPSHTHYNQIPKKCHVPCYTWVNLLPPPQTHIQPTLNKHKAYITKKHKTREKNFTLFFCTSGKELKLKLCFDLFLCFSTSFSMLLYMLYVIIIIFIIIMLFLVYDVSVCNVYF